MKILMYSNKFGGPTTTFIQNDLVNLSVKHEMLYLSTEIDPNATFSYPDKVIIPFKRGPIRTKILWILERRGLFLNYRNKAFSVQVNKVISTFQPQLILCNFGIEALVLIHNLNERNSRIPVVINFLGYDASFHLNRPSYVSNLLALAQKDNVYATSNTNFLKKNLEVKGVYFKENRVIHTGVNVAFFDRQDHQPESKNYIFLQIALLSARKGQEVTIRAFKQMLGLVPDPERFKLILAGGEEPGIGEVIRKLPAQLGIDKQVEFTSWITPIKARELMLDANCFVHHSRTIEGRTEGVPTAVSEAMAMELPVISTWHAGISELVEEGENGFLIEENDIETYSKRMVEIQAFPLLKVNRDKVVENFNILKRTEALEDYFEDILKLNLKQEF
ncbi:MAG: glycosyltransferase family 4 protein [Bacteroidia bacterium]